MFCLNGFHHAHDCKLTTNKSVNIIEKSLLGFLHERVITEENAKALVSQGNIYLAELASQPPAELKPLKAEIRSLANKIRRNDLDAEEEDDKVARQ
jgi:hypothetical protein